MFLRDPARDRQPEPGSLARARGVRLVEALEDALQIFLGDTRAVIEHHEACRLLAVI